MDSNLPESPNQDQQKVDRRLRESEEKIKGLEARNLELEKRIAALNEEQAAAREQWQREEYEVIGQNELLRSVLSQAGVTVFNEGKDLKIVWIINPFPNFFDPNPEGKTEAEVMPFMDAKYIMDLKREVIESGIGSRTDLWLHVGGQLCYYDYVVEPIRDQSGAVCGVLGSAVDITERKKIFDALRQTKNVLQDYAAQLEQANNQLNEFASIASHDLQEPLRKIKKFGELLANQNKKGFDPEAKDIIARMSSAADRMGVMIENVLTLSRAGVQELNLVPVDLSKVMQNVLEDLEVRIQQTQGQVEVGELPVIRADALQMHQLFQNLVGNGLKYHRQGIPPRVQIWAEYPSKEKANLFIKDYGIGFHEQDLERIFQPFQRLHSRSEYEGTGMGLAICRKIVERHGGSIMAKSTLGDGSTFIVTLPDSR